MRRAAAPPPWGPAPMPVAAVIATVCLGRGRQFYEGQPNVETAALRAALPPGTPVVGMFANGALDVMARGLQISRGWVAESRTLSSV